MVLAVAVALEVRVAAVGEDVVLAVAKVVVLAVAVEMATGGVHGPSSPK